MSRERSVSLATGACGRRHQGIGHSVRQKGQASQRRFSWPRSFAMPRPALSRTLPVRPAFSAILSRPRPRTGPGPLFSGAPSKRGVPGQSSRMQCRSGETADACGSDLVKVAAGGVASIVSIDTPSCIFTRALLYDGVPSPKDAKGSEDTVNSFLCDNAPPDGRAPSSAACVFAERGESADARRYPGVRGRPQYFSALVPCCPLRR